MRLYPFYEAHDFAQTLMAKGATIHQQFKCVHCGTKQTMQEANKFFKVGQCEECWGMTNIEKKGCNYLASFDLEGGK